MITLLEPADLQSVMRKPDAQLFDVRGEDEWREGHIDGARLVPLSVFPFKVAEYAKDLYTPIVVYCRSGNRSAHAAHILEELGYKEIYNLAGGFVAYEA